MGRRSSVVFDRGVVSEDNLQDLRQRGAYYLVGTPRRKLAEFERELLAGDWQEIAGKSSGKKIHTSRERQEEQLREMVRGVNDILQPQANVVFDLVKGPGASITLAGNQGASVTDEIFNALPGHINPVADFHVFFVWAYGGSGNGDALAGTTLIDNHGYCVFEDGIPYRREIQTLAHEAVHYLLLSFGFVNEHHTKSLGDLMYPRSGAYEFEAGTRLGRRYADIINPWDTV